MIINRAWAMPNKNTFSIKPIGELIKKWFPDNILTLDPFANTNRIAGITNDLDKSFNCTCSMDAYEFLQLWKNDSMLGVLFDPPYSPRQVSESYKKLGKSVNMETTQASYWSRMKDEIARVLSPEGLCISFGWNSNGIGKKRGFEILEILLVAHGGAHNDTICMVEKKII